MAMMKHGRHARHGKNGPSGRSRPESSPRQKSQPREELPVKELKQILSIPPPDSRPSKNTSQPPEEPSSGLKRSRSFQAQLAKEYGVEQMPESLRRAIEKTCRELPEEMPVRHRPVLSLVRTAATAAAVLVLAFAALLGVNTTYPQLTEALPGLGPVFSAINGEKKPPEESLPQPSPRPAFEKIRLESQGDFPGSMTVEDAWSDGRFLYLDLSLELTSDGLMQMSNFSDNCYLHGGSPHWDSEYGNYLGLSDSATLQAAGENGQAASDTGYLSNFVRDGQSGRFTASWRLNLANEENMGENLAVSLSLPDLTLVDNSQNLDNGMTEPVTFAWSAGFAAKFPVVVDTARNRVLRPQAADNGVVLQSVDYSPSQMSFQLDIPFTGLVDNTLVSFNFSYFDNSGLLGTFLQVTNLKGEPMQYNLDHMELDPWDDVLKEQTGTLRGTFVVQSDSNPRDVSGPLLLTLYETPLPDPSQEAVFGQFPFLSRVTAEFTLDLSTGRVYASEHYLEEDRVKADTSRLYSRVKDFDENQLLACDDFSLAEIGASGRLCAVFSLADQDPFANRQLLVNAYLDMQPVTTFNVTTGCDAAEDDYGSYYEFDMSLPAAEDLPCRVMTFQIYYPDWLITPEGLLTDAFDRLELVDLETGKVLIPDLGRKWLGDGAQAIGGLVGADVDPQELGLTAAASKGFFLADSGSMPESGSDAGYTDSMPESGEKKNPPPPANPGEEDLAGTDADSGFHPEGGQAIDSQTSGGYG